MNKINSTLFKIAMSKFATGITVISMNKKNEYFGKTVNSFSSLSIKPPLVLFSLDENSSSIKEYTERTFLGINILSNKQKNISQHFSKKQPKWNDTKFFLTQKNTPMIEDSLVNIHCQINKKIKQGDHIIFICKVIDVLINNKKNPLIYLNSNYV